MQTVTITWDAPASTMPEGTPAEDHYHVELGDMTQDIPRTTTPLAAVFADVPPGEYLPAVQLIDVNGNALGDEAVGDVYTVPDEGPVTVTVHIPQNVQASGA